jgi:hypothetical protein
MFMKPKNWALISTSYFSRIFVRPQGEKNRANDTNQWMERAFARAVGFMKNIAIVTNGFTRQVARESLQWSMRSRGVKKVINRRHHAIPLLLSQKGAA